MPVRKRRALLVTGVALTLVATGMVAACGKSEDTGSATTTSTSTDPKDIAADAYVYGFPLVLMDVTREAGTAGVPANRIAAVGPIDPAQNTVVMPNVDTVYASAWLDLAAEPIILQVPVMSDRYWLMQVMDAWTNTVHDPSSVNPHTDAGKSAPYAYAITGPNWSGTLPADVTRLSMPTEMAWLIGRIEYRDAADLPAAQARQRELIMTPLSAWERGERPAPMDSPATAQAVSPPQAVAQLDGRTFFDRLDRLMLANPPAAADAPALQRFERIGVKPGGTTDSVSVEALNAGMMTARDRIPAYRNPAAKNENGWAFATDLGAYGTNYDLRAHTAWTALGANLPKDAVYPQLTGDAGTPDAPKRYRLTFPQGKTPPAQAFWSLTAYTGDGYLVPNPAAVYSVGHQVPVTPGPDGTVELAIQAADPGSAVPQGNWLPIPESGKFGLTLRMYAPQGDALDGDWQPPALTPVD
ncbi:DUF1254 domain-containing protein [Nocardia sp. 2]|uniref:DUF1254 domain-containing protein n=1 Tax=Nocardia acididurans TaxID=2802282 RepID=A0ABS1MEK6_9NOCA|nr:DUF1254 domain-containing protein [Nocardia acididurans]MBL1078694.1 DUF1254 domain-containing protein [Nocardia acididurans]